MLVNTKTGLPRRNHLDMQVPAEAAITEAMAKVEAMGCSEKLSDALSLLVEAKACISDFVDDRLSIGEVAGE